MCTHSTYTNIMTMKKTLSAVSHNPDNIDDAMRALLKRHDRSGLAPRSRSHFDMINKTIYHVDGHTELPTLGVTDVEDWATYGIEQSWYLNDLNIYQAQHNYLVPENFKFVDWIESTDCSKFTYFNSRNFLLQWPDGYISVRYGDTKFLACVAGPRLFVDQWVERLNSTFTKPRNSVKWVYDNEGHEISVPLNYRRALQSAYPWIDRPLHEYITDYLNSDACVLILLGPPGTGKTTFIKNVIHHSNGDAKVAYNTEVLDSDQFFAHFIDGDENILVLEDADAFLSSRSSGNNMMHRFLNVSDGLISASGKKIIFSTNLPSISDVDSALMRPGRCYDVIEFRALNRTEAQSVLQEADSSTTLGDGAEFTLAEIFNPGPHTSSIVKKKIGF